MIDPGGNPTIETLRCTGCASEISAQPHTILAALRCGWTVRREGSFLDIQARDGTLAGLGWTSTCPHCEPPLEVEDDGFVTLHPRTFA